MISFDSKKEYQRFLDNLINRHSYKIYQESQPVSIYENLIFLSQLPADLYYARTNAIFADRIPPSSLGTWYEIHEDDPGSEYIQDSSYALIQIVVTPEDP